MIEDFNLCDYVGEEVVHMLCLFQESGKTLLDYKIIGNKYATTVVLRFNKHAADDMVPSTPVLNFKSPATRLRDYKRIRQYSQSLLGVKHKEINESCNMPLSHAGERVDGGDQCKHSEDGLLWDEEWHEDRDGDDDISDHEDSADGDSGNKITVHEDSEDRRSGDKISDHEDHVDRNSGDEISGDEISNYEDNADIDSGDEISDHEDSTDGDCDDDISDHENSADGESGDDDIQEHGEDSGDEIKDIEISAVEESGDKISDHEDNACATSRRNMSYDKVYKDRTQPGANRLIGITDDYIVQYICSTCVVRVLDKRGAEYGKMKRLVAKWQPIDIDSHHYLTENNILTKVLWNSKSHHINKWMHLNKIILDE